MEILANQELATFWAAVMSAIQAATYVTGSLFLVIFLTMAVTEFRHRKKLPVDEPRD